MSHENKSVTFKISYFLKRANEIRINELESKSFSLMKGKVRNRKRFEIFFLSTLNMFTNVYQLPFCIMIRCKFFLSNESLLLDNFINIHIFFLFFFPKFVLNSLSMLV